jgi:hypothetical protein
MKSFESRDRKAAWGMGELLNEDDAIALAVTIDRVILESRLVDISLLAQADRRDRVGMVATVLSRLRPGGYLLG